MPRVVRFLTGAAGRALGIEKVPVRRGYFSGM